MWPLTGTLSTFPKFMFEIFRFSNLLSIAGILYDEVKIITFLPPGFVVEVEVL